MSELAVNKVYFLTDHLAEVLNPIKEATQLKDISFGKTDSSYLAPYSREVLDTEV